jgi:hypothetical protein
VEGIDEAEEQEDGPQPIECPEGTVFSIKAGECVSEGPQQIVPQEQQEDGPQPIECPEGLEATGGICVQEELLPTESDESQQEQAAEEGISEGESDVDPELLSELRGGETDKNGGNAEGGGEESDGDLETELRGGETTKQAPIAISGENVYTTWWTNSTANNNDEVMFRASTDGGRTFGDKINLSNSTGADSQDVEITAEGENIVVTWWERNATNSEPVSRLSTDNGTTFGSLLKLESN